VDEGGNFLVTATRPEGPWSQPKYFDAKGFDPSLFFDTDGTAYYTRDGFRDSPDHPLIFAGRIDLHRGKLLEKIKPIYAGTGGPWAEASHLYRYGNYYYLVIAEGGTYYEHSVVVARSKKPMGPFTSCPYNPVLGHEKRPKHLFQATGHADLVDTPDGQTFAVLLGIRPKGGRFHHLGRETFLVPVTWTEDGWPLLGKRGEVEVTPNAPNLPSCPWPKMNPREDFDGKKLPFEFVFVRNQEPKCFSLTARPGYLRLHGLPGTTAEMAPVSFVGRRQQHFECSFSTSLEFYPKGMSDEAGLVVRANEDFHYALVVRRSSVENEHEREVSLWSIIAGKKKLIEKLPLGKGAVLLEIRATAKDYEFSFGAGKRRKVLGTLTTRALSVEYLQRKTGVLSFTGVVVGLYASGQGQRAQSPADFDWFEYRAFAH
jgi:alpha-N-arabinofuranosidase